MGWPYKSIWSVIVCDMYWIFQRKYAIFLPKLILNQHPQSKRGEKLGEHQATTSLTN